MTARGSEARRKEVRKSGRREERNEEKRDERFPYDEARLAAVRVIGTGVPPGAKDIARGGLQTNEAKQQVSVMLFCGERKMFGSSSFTSRLLSCSEPG